MMIQNAAFIADAVPAPAGPGAAGGSAAPGAGGFQQLLQGKQQVQAKPLPAKPEAEQASAADRPAPAKSSQAPSRQVKGEGKPEQPEQAGGSARHGLPAEAAQTPAAQKAAVANGKLPAQAKKEAAKEQDKEQDKVQDGKEARQPVGGETPSASSANPETRPVEQEAVQQEAQQAAQAPETSAADQAGTAATGTVPATAARPEVNPGIVVALAAVEAGMAARSEGANPEAGATAVARLEAVQPRLPQPAVPETTADVDNVQTQRQQAANQQDQPAGIAAGASASQEAELAKLTREARGAQVLPSTGATEEAQVEKPQAPAARGAATEKREISPTLPDAAKTAVVPDQAVAAAHISASQTGEGRFVAMPVRNLSTNAGEPTAASETAASQPTPVPEGAPQQDVQQQNMQQPGVQQQNTQQVEVPALETATAGMTGTTTQGAAAGATGATTQGAEAEQATLQVKGELRGEKAAAQREQQAEPVRTSPEEAGLVAEKGPQRRELRLGEAAGGKQVAEAEQARQGNLVNPSGDDLSGTKSASTATAKLTSELGAVREMSGAHGEQAGSGQKGQEQQNGQMLGAGMTAQGGAAEAAQVETRQAGGRNPLHESILSQVREGVVTHDGKGNGQMSIRLNPGELGELKIRLSMENNRLNVQVHADNHVVKDLLMSNLDSLREALSGKNLSMEGFNVSTGGGGFNAPLNEERGDQRRQQAPRFARGAGYDGQEAPRVNYLTAEVNNLLDVRF